MSVINVVTKSTNGIFGRGERRGPSSVIRHPFATVGRSGGLNFRRRTACRAS
jgi:hypothetical protein